MAEEYELKMQKAIEATEREFSKIRTSVATPAILNNIFLENVDLQRPIFHQLIKFLHQHLSQLKKPISYTFQMNMYEPDYQ